jgi:cyclic pyranopterin monophosphate synthase
MIDITHKFNTLRIALAEATVMMGSEETMKRVQNKSVPKGDVLEMAKTAGLLGVKQTPHLIPDCHPLPMESTSVKYELDSNSIRILVECKTIYKTGVEVEAMHGASVVALTIYDMLKPIDKNIEIRNIRLVNKSGGKSDLQKRNATDMTAAVINCSNAIVRGDKETNASDAAVLKLKDLGLENIMVQTVAENETDLKQVVNSLVAEKLDLIICLGSTGLTAKDISSKVFSELIQIPAPGVIEAARVHGLDRSPAAMLSNGQAGFIDSTFVLALPGSKNGAKESLERLFPFLFHVLAR